MEAAIVPLTQYAGSPQKLMMGIIQIPARKTGPLYCMAKLVRGTVSPRRQKVRKTSDTPVFQAPYSPCDNLFYLWCGFPT